MPSIKKHFVKNNHVIDRKVDKSNHAATLFLNQSLNLKKSLNIHHVPRICSTYIYILEAPTFEMPSTL